MARTSELKIELTAQVARCRELGLEPSHIDSHHHLHAHPRLRSLINLVCPGLGITKMRGYQLHARSLKAYGVVAAASLPARGRALTMPDRFSGIEVMGRKNIAGWIANELSARGDALEFMCHPAYADKRLAQVSSYNMPRQTELESLTSDEFAAVLAAARVKLISFREL
jgi:hypothetical protein